MSGAGLGGTLGGLAGAALAPETGGLSLLIPAAAGAIGSAAGGALTGSKNVGMDALAGGVAGGIPGLGEATGLGSSLSAAQQAALWNGIGGAASGGIRGGNLQSALLGGATGAGLGYVGNNMFGGGTPPMTDSAAAAANPSGMSFDAARNLSSDIGKGGGDYASQAFNSNWSPGGNSAPSGINPGSVSAPVNAPTSTGSGISDWISKNPTGALGVGAMLLGALQKQQGNSVDIGGQAAAVKGSSPGYSSGLPSYHMESSSTPYQGNWYTYGERPQDPLYKNRAVQGLKHGGMPQAGQPMASPLSSAVGSGQVRGPGDGHSDSVPAMLSKDEFVMPADVVGYLGNGSSDAGGDALNGMVKNVRAHKATKGFPPKAKSPLAYIKGKKS